MLMFAAWLSFVSGAATAEPTVSVLVSRRTGVPAATADSLARQVSTALVAEQVPLKLDADAARTAVARLGLSSSVACDGRKRCLVELARQLNVEWVVVLSVAQLGADRSMAIELLRQDGVVVAKEALLFGADAVVTREQLAAFATQVRSALGISSPVALTPVAPPPDAPVAPPPQPVLTPVPPPASQGVLMPAPPVARTSHAPAFVLGGAAAASLAAGVALLVTGLVDHAKAVETQPRQGSERLALYSAEEVLSRANDADRRTGLGVGLAVVAAGLATGAVLSW